MKPSANASLAARVRDPRIDLTRGIANWFIFLDHIPHNAVNLLTLRNFGFSGAADLFIFVAGYAAALFYGRMARERGLIVTTTRIFRRLWQLYAAYVVLFVIYIDVVSNVACANAGAAVASTAAKARATTAPRRRPGRVMRAAPAVAPGD